MHGGWAGGVGVSRLEELLAVCGLCVWGGGARGLGGENDR
jgi:hypothetical protein